MTDQAIAEALQIDDPADDVRRAIDDLKLTGEPEARVVIDNSSAQADRARDEEGKFAKAPKEAKAERKTLTLPEKDAGVKPGEAQIGVEQPETVAAVQTVKAPDSWRADIRSKFADLPPDVQAEINRREQDIVRGLSKQDDERQFGRKVSEIVSPYLPTIRAEGGTPEKAIQDLLQTAHELRNPNENARAQTIVRAMQAFKVQPQTLLSILQGASVVSGQPQQPGTFDPRYESLAQTVARIEQERQEDLQQRQLQEADQARELTSAFASQPGHEHFDTVREKMGELIVKGLVPANDLQVAYDVALGYFPEIRNSQLAASVQANQSQRIAEQTARTVRAKQAAVSVVGGPGGAKPNGSAHPSSSIEDDLRAAMREHSGRV